MAGNVIVDASFVVALLSDSERNHGWAVAEAERLPPPWQCCDAVLSEIFYLLGDRGLNGLTGLLRRRTVVSSFHLGAEVEEVLALMHKYANVPMSLADACLVRMTEKLSDPIVFTMDNDFRIYRRHGRQAIPCVMPR